MKHSSRVRIAHEWNYKKPLTGLTLNLTIKNFKKAIKIFPTAHGKMMYLHSILCYSEGGRSVPPMFSIFKKRIESSLDFVFSA